MSNAQYIKMREWNSFYDVSFIDMTKKNDDKKMQVVDVIVALRMTVIMVLKR